MEKMVVSGAINWDYNLFVERFPEPGEEVPVVRFEQVPGGKGANASVSAAFFLGRGKVAFLGALGDDEVGDRQIGVLEDAGVVTSGVKRAPGVPSGQAYITIEASGQNTITTVFGANLKLSPEDLAEQPRRRLITTADCVAVTDPPLPTVTRLASLAKDGKAKVVWDLATHSQRPIDELAETLSHVDYLVMNEVEAKLLAGSQDPKQVRECAARYNPEISVVVKLGAKGSRYASAEDGLFVPGIPLDEFGLRVANTTGSGDAFMGGFASALAAGKDVTGALVQGSAAGAAKATLTQTRLTGDRDRLDTLVADLGKAIAERMRPL